MTIILEMPATIENYTGSVELETGTVESANEAVALLESEAPAEDQETIGEAPETTVPLNETAGQVDETSANLNGTPAEATENPSAVNETCQECNCDSVEPSSVKIEFERTPRQIAEAEFFRDVRRATDELADATLERLRIEAELKDAKARCKRAAEGLQQLIDRGPQIRTRPPCAMHRDEATPLDQSTAQPATESVAPDATTWAAAQDQPASAQPVSGDAWRYVPLADLQLKVKLQERLEEVGVNTIGRLEDLRAEISNHREKWPKGIGKAKITEIEDAVINWLSKNRDAQIFAEAKSTQTADTHQPETAMNDENREDDIEQRVKSIQAEGVAGLKPVSCTIDDSKGPYVSGAEAYDKGWILTDCPYVSGPEQDDWLRGWLASQSTNEWLDPDKIADTEREPSSELVSEVKEPSLDDL